MSARRLTPEFKERVWGTTTLEPWFPNPSAKIGEVWFDAGPGTPLVKFLFTTEKLSVQVHPEDAYAQEHHASPGKTEMWHVLAAEPGAKIVAGFRREITREEAAAAARSGEIEALLQEYEARVGDTFFIPSGTVHAIGRGLTICEIQQRSDITYRLYDYGRPRELQLEHGLRVSHFRPCAARRSLPVSCPYFWTDLVRVSGEWTEPDERGRIIAALSGEGNIAGIPSSPGEVWLSPPGSGPITVSGRLKFLEIVF